MSSTENKHCEDGFFFLDASNDEEAAHLLHWNNLQSVSPELGEKILTADEVIREIDEIMNKQIGDHVIAQGTSHVKVKRTFVTWRRYTIEDLKNMSPLTLQELNANYERKIKILSDLLVSKLDLRDQLDFDKELKNEFIWQLQAVHKKLRNRRKKSILTRFASSKSVNWNNDRFITLSIPYDPCRGQPTSEQLQVFIKILQAINEDSSSVPKVLVNYILTVFCPR